MIATAWSDAEVDVIVQRMTERLRPGFGWLSDEELTGLAAELFLEGARFALDWMEN
jgi:hypothetical protein